MIAAAAPRRGDAGRCGGRPSAGLVLAYAVAGLVLWEIARGEGQTAFA